MLKNYVFNLYENFLKITRNSYQNECHQTTFLYDGHCYKICPNRTYMLPEVPAYYPSKTYLVEPLMMTSNDQVNTFYDNDGILTQNNPAINTKYNYKIFETHKRAIMRPTSQKLCSSCDPSCFKCDGPNAGDCTECSAGYQLRKLSSTNTFCYYLAERSSGNSGQGNVIHFNKKHNGAKLNIFRNYNDNNNDNDDENDDNDASIRNDLTMFFIIIIPAISMIFIVVALTIFGRKCKSFSFKNCGNDSYSYDRVVAFEIEDDDVNNIGIQKNNFNIDNSGALENQNVIIDHHQIPSTSKQYQSRKQGIEKTLLGNSDDSDDDYGNY